MLVLCSSTFCITSSSTVSSLRTASSSMAMARDRLSALPDNILSSHILSKLSLRDATRCSLLSRRWRYLCTLLSHLKFTFSSFFHDGETNQQAIDYVLFFHSAQLESFELSLSMGDLDRGKIGKCLQRWVQSASLKRVKQIALEIGIFLDVPTSLFSCECLTLLKLELLFFTWLPPYFRGFRCLVTCSLSLIDTNDDILEHFVANCHLLENLTIQDCTGLSNVKIFAVNLKCLNIIEFGDKTWVRVNCPKLVNFTVHDCPRMSMLELKSCGSLHLSTTELSLLKDLSTTNSLKKVSFCGFTGQVDFLEVLESFVSLEELSIECERFKDDTARQEASKWSFSLKSLKKAHIKVSGFDEEVISLIGCLLRSAPLLQTMTLALPRCSRYSEEQSFLEQLRDLIRRCEEQSFLEQLLALKRRCEANGYMKNQLIFDVIEFDTV